MNPHEPLAGAEHGESDAFAAGNNDFALAMFGRFRQERGNLFLSPFSIRLALGMTQAGARGKTAAQMREVLRGPDSDETLHAGFAGVLQRFHAAGGEYELAVANSLWSQEGEPLRPELVDRIVRQYGGVIHPVDFRRDVETVRETINQWVEDRTKRKIQDLIPPSCVDAETRLVLVNAVYFKGLWMCQFSREDTRDEPFRLEGGRTVQAPMMYLRAYVPCMQAKGFQAVDLAYQGGDFSMLVLLPDKQNGLRDLEKRLSVRMLDDCVARLELHNIRVFLPRFRITWGTVDLCKPLSSLGMKLAFSPSQADFSGINGHKPPHPDALFIASVLHKAFVEVNEEGTEAAAATAVIMVRSLPPAFRADHPFLFAIRDRRSGAILFLGRITDPTRES